MRCFGCFMEEVVKWFNIEVSEHLRVGNTRGGVFNSPCSQAIFLRCYHTTRNIPCKKMFTRIRPNYCTVVI